MICIMYYRHPMLMAFITQMLLKFGTLNVILTAFALGVTGDH